MKKKYLTKSELYEKLQSATQCDGDNESLIKNICDWMDSSELQEFIEFVENERGY